MTPAIRFRVMPSSVVSHPAWPALDTRAALLCFELHVGTIATTTLGIYVAPRTHLELASRSTREELDAALVELHAHGFVEFDRDYEVMRLPRWLADYRPASVRSFTQSLEWLTHIPNCHARALHLEHLRLSADAWGSKYVAAVERAHTRLCAQPVRATQLPLPLAVARIR